MKSDDEDVQEKLLCHSPGAGDGHEEFRIHDLRNNKSKYGRSFVSLFLAESREY
jgi:hypothetical protein